MNDIRVKQFIFSPQSLTGSNWGPTYTDYVINGDILKIIVQGITSAGSLALGESGAQIEFWRQNNIASGAAPFEVHPFVYGVNSVNTTGSPQAILLRNVNAKIYMTGSGFTSGAAAFGPVTVYYR